MRVTIPDDLADTYQKFADAHGVPLDAVLADQLKRLAPYEPGKRLVALTPDQVDQLEPRLGGGSVKDGTDLTRKVLTLAGIRFHRIDLDFTPQQLEELAHRAERQGKSVQALCIEIIDSMKDQFFWTSGGGAAVGETPMPAPPKRQKAS